MVFLHFLKIKKGLRLLLNYVIFHVCYNPLRKIKWELESQLSKVLILKAGGPKFKSQNPHKKLGMSCAYNPSAGIWIDVSVLYIIIQVLEDGLTGLLA